MRQIVQHVAYGFNGGSIPTMTDKQLISAFFFASENIPSIDEYNRQPIIANMGKIADEISDRTDAAKGQRKIKLTVHLIVMQTIIKDLYKKVEAK